MGLSSLPAYRTSSGLDTRSLPLPVLTWGVDLELLHVLNRYTEPQARVWGSFRKPLTVVCGVQVKLLLREVLKLRNGIGESE